jgi:small-conductance mechanosensitive channel
MTRSLVVGVAAVVTVALVCVDRPAARAADSPGGDVFKKHGLKLAGTLAVADEEAEIKTKLSEFRRTSKQLSYSLIQQQGTMGPREQQQNIKSLTDAINQLKTEVSAVDRQMGQIPRNNSRYGGRYASGSFLDSNAADMYAELEAYKVQLQMELNQDSLILNELKNQTLDPRAKDKIDAEVRDQRDLLHETILDLRKLIDAASAKYAEAAKSDEVAKALVVASKGLKEKAKLGPSREFQSNVKLVERLEKADATGATAEPPAPRTRRNRGRSKGKISSKAVAKPVPDAAAENSAGASSS